MQNASRERLTLQVRTETRGPTGVTVTWADVTTVWGNVTPLSSRARANLGALQGEATHTLTLREITVRPLFGKHRVLGLGRAWTFLEPPAMRGRDVTSVVREDAP